MPRGLSVEALREMVAEETSDLFLFLLEINPNDGNDIIRIVDDNVDLDYDGNTYLACPFELTLPSDTEEDQIPAAKIKVQNVDRKIVEAVRSVEAKPSASLGIIRRSSDDSTKLEIPFMNFQLDKVTYDIMEVSGTLGYEKEFLSAPATADIFDPQTFPGLFP